MPEYKIGIEIDECNHESRNSNFEKSRQLMIESHGITIIRTNIDAADSNMNRLINQIYKHINQLQVIKIKELEEKLKHQENKIKEKDAKIKELEEKMKDQEKKIKEKEEELKRKFATELLSYVASISMPLKHIKNFVKKILPTL